MLSTEFDEEEVLLSRWIIRAARNWYDHGKTYAKRCGSDLKDSIGRLLDLRIWSVLDGDLVDVSIGSLVNQDLGT